MAAFTAASAALRDSAGVRVGAVAAVVVGFVGGSARFDGAAAEPTIRPITASAARAGPLPLRRPNKLGNGIRISSSANTDRIAPHPRLAKDCIPFPAPTEFESGTERAQ